MAVTINVWVAVPEFQGVWSALSRGDGYLAFVQTGHGVPISGITPKGNHRGIIAVEGKSGKSRIRSYIEGGELVNLPVELAGR